MSQASVDERLSREEVVTRFITALSENSLFITPPRRGSGMYTISGQGRYFSNLSEEQMGSIAQKYSGTFLAVHRQFGGRAHYYLTLALPHAELLLLDMLETLDMVGKVKVFSAEKDRKKAEMLSNWCYIHSPKHTDEGAEPEIIYNEDLQEPCIAYLVLNEAVIITWSFLLRALSREQQIQLLACDRSKPIEARQQMGFDLYPIIFYRRSSWSKRRSKKRSAKRGSKRRSAKRGSAHRRRRS